MKKIYLGLVICFLSLGFSQVVSQFSYTSLKLEDCATLSINSEQDYGIEECPALGAYRVYYAYGDARSWLELEKNGSRFSFAPWNLGGAIKGFFPYVSAELVEWRYLTLGSANMPRLEPYALIYRMTYQDSQDASKFSDVLIVLRLEENNVCYLGYAQSNLDARVLADNFENGCNH